MLGPSALAQADVGNRNIAVSSSEAPVIIFLMIWNLILIAAAAAVATIAVVAVAAAVAGVAAVAAVAAIVAVRVAAAVAAVEVKLNAFVTWP